MRAFVIDDSRVNRLTLSTVIARIEGAKVEEFDNPVEALERLSADPPDIVIVDQMMERMSGVEFIRKARSMPALDTLPIVMATSSERKEIRREALDAGATDFIAKPVDMIEFKARVRNLMTLRRASSPRSGMVGLAELLAEAFSEHDRRSNQSAMRDPSERRVAAYAAVMLQDLGIPDLSRRILQVAMTFDALAAGSQGHAAMTLDEARARVVAEAGDKLDRGAVDTFLRTWDLIEQIYDSSASSSDL